MKYQIAPTANMMSMSGETSGSSIWKITMLGNAIQPSTPFLAENPAMLPHRLQNAERPAKTLAHQAIGVGGSLGVGQSHVFVFHAVTEAEQSHGKVGIFGDGVDVIAAGLAHGGDAPGANRARYHADRAQNVERPPLEILAGDVLQRLPAGPKIHAIANLGVARDGGDFGIEKVRHQAGDRVGGDDGIGVDADE